jgi:hypothetical protein
MPLAGHGTKEFASMKKPNITPPPAAETVRQLSWEPLWTIQDLSAYSKIARATIYSDLVRAPWRVPPPLPSRGGSGLRWNPAKARGWFEGEGRDPPPSGAAAKPRSKRGRKTKAEEVARRARAASWPGDACQD